MSQQTHAALVDRAVSSLDTDTVFKSGDHEFGIAVLVRKADWRPLRTAWWKGREVSIIGADYEGNF